MTRKNGKHEQESAKLYFINNNYGIYKEIKQRPHVKVYTQDHNNISSKNSSNSSSLKCNKHIIHQFCSKF